MTVTFQRLKTLLTTLATMAALLIGSRSAAAAPPGEPLPPPPEADAKFAAAASAGNVKELKASGLAQGKAKSDDVKNFARKMAEDHAKANQELSVLIVKKGLKCSNGGEADTLKSISSLSATSGAAFDKAYMAMMVQDHRAAVTLYEGQAKDGEDPELKTLAEKRVAALKEHLKLAEEVAAKVGVKTDDKSKGPTTKHSQPS